MIWLFEIFLKEIENNKFENVLLFCVCGFEYGVRVYNSEVVVLKVLMMI